MSATNAKELKKMAVKLINASLKSEVAVSIEFCHRTGEDKWFSINVVFSTGSEGVVFFTNLYDFYSEEKNKKLLTAAIELMKDASKFKEIKRRINALERES